MKKNCFFYSVAFLLSAVTVLFCFAGCGKATGDSGKTDKKTEASEFSPNWVIAPEIDVQSVEPLVRADYNETTKNYEISFADCFRYKKDGKFGLFDINGKSVADAVYDDIFAIRSSEDFVGVRNIDGEVSKTYIYNKSFETEPAYRSYNTEYFEYYWDTVNDSALFVLNSGDSVTKSDFSPALPETVKGVKQAGNRYVPDGTYGLFYNSSNVTGMRFSNAGMFSDGLAAFESNGKWGYLDSTGRTVIPFEYDAVGNYSAFGVGSTAYESSGGYVTLKKGDKFGVCDNAGNEIIPFILDGATPVVNGLLFAKTNGKWGVLSVEKKTAGSETKAVTTTVPVTAAQTTTENAAPETTAEEYVWDREDYGYEEYYDYSDNNESDGDYEYGYDDDSGYDSGENQDDWSGEEEY